MDYALIQLIAGLLVSVFNVAVMIKGFRKLTETKDEVFEEIDSFTEKALTFYAQEKADVVENIPKLIAGAIHAPIMSQLGKMSGVSRQMKGLEKDLIAEGIGQATGNPALGGLAAKYIQKYPVLAQVLPMLAARKAPNNGPGQSAQGPQYGEM